MKCKKFKTFELALSEASEDEQERIQADFDFNKKVTGNNLKRIEETYEPSWYVIEGMVYWKMKLGGEEKGMSLMHLLELVNAAIDNKPFYRVIEWTDQLAFLMRDKSREPVPLSRSLKRRKEYAQMGWTLTTASSLYFAAQEDKGIDIGYALTEK